MMREVYQDSAVECLWSPGAADSDLTGHGRQRGTPGIKKPGQAGFFTGLRIKILKNLSSLQQPELALVPLVSQRRP